MNKNPPANAGDTGSIPGPGRFRMLNFLANPIPYFVNYPPVNGHLDFFHILENVSDAAMNILVQGFV